MIQKMELHRDDELIRNIPSVLNIAVFEKIENDSFRLLGTIPSWLNVFLPAKKQKVLIINPAQIFPFIENFLIEAERFWKMDLSGRIKSGLWIESGKEGSELRLEATALVIEGRKLLLIEFLDSVEFDERMQLFQKSRDKSLIHERLIKTERALQKAHDELEIRVKERTKELAKKTQELKIELRRRIQAEKELKLSLLKLKNSMEGAVSSLSSVLEMRDPYTAGHQRRVTDLACAIAREMGIEESRIDGIRLGGLVHDIGKIQVPSDILTKPGRISDAEFTLIKTHAQAGYEILKSIEFEWPIADMVCQHHEKMNGTGYPQGLKGDEILLEARIITVADVVEAMSSYRPYRQAIGIGPALEEIEHQRGILYDKDVVDACLILFRKKHFNFNQQ